MVECTPGFSEGTDFTVTVTEKHIIIVSPIIEKIKENRNSVLTFLDSVDSLEFLDS